MEVGWSGALQIIRITRWVCLVSSKRYMQYSHFHQNTLFRVKMWIKKISKFKWIKNRYFFGLGKNKKGHTNWIFNQIRLHQKWMKFQSHRLFDTFFTVTNCSKPKPKTPITPNAPLTKGVCVSIRARSFPTANFYYNQIIRSGFFHFGHRIISITQNEESNVISYGAVRDYRR